MRPFTMYHLEYAPTGQDFDLDEGHSREELVSQGWVDNPAKIGVNVWNPDDDAINKRVAQMKRDFDDGVIPAVDDPNFQSDRLRAEAEENTRRLQEREEMLRENEDLRERLRQSEQRFADMESDGNKLAGKPDPEHQVQVPAGADGVAATGDGATAGAGDTASAEGQGASAGDKTAPTDEEIAAAIKGLPPEGYTQAGVPKVTAIEEALGGRPIDGKIRDRVWAAVEAELHNG